MSLKSRHLALIAVAAAAVTPTSALAMVDGPRAVPKAVPHCGIDYSRNSVDGRYCDPTPSGTAAVPTTSNPVIVAHETSFSWGDAGVGAGAAIALMSVGAGGAIAFRRRARPAV